MKSRAYDMAGVVHMTDFKGAPFASCFDGDSTVEDAPAVSRVFLPRQEPLTCVKCIALESTMKPVENDDDDEA